MSDWHARVGVFVDGQAGGGVRLEDVADAFLHPALAHQFLNLAGYVDHLGPLLGAHAQGVDHAHLRMSPASPGEAIRPDGVAGSRGCCIS